jgi:pyruvate dehydrogenase E1 component alpha subunit
MQLQRRPNIVTCFFGDGAVNRGPFLEALNWACLFKLPVLFVCEDNRWSSTSKTDELTAGPGIVARSAALGVPAERVDGNDVEAVAALAQRLVREIRAGEGPRLIHGLTRRMRGHLSADKQSYRDPTDIEIAEKQEPILRARIRLLEAGTSQAEIDSIDEAVARELQDALDFAEASPEPEAVEAFVEVQMLGGGTWY